MLVLLHPIGLDSRCWQFLDRELLEHSVQYDLLWHGGRSRPSTPLTLAAFADDVVANINGTFDVAGVSMGGAVAQHIALRHPARVKSLFLAACGAGGENGAAQLARAAAVDAGGVGAVLESTLQRWFTESFLERPDHPAITYVRNALTRNSADAFASSWRALAGHNTLERLNSIIAPTTLLHPAHDAAGSLDGKRQMAARLPRARLEVIDGPHMIQLERPSEFSSVLRGHLQWAAGLDG